MSNSLKVNFVTRDQYLALKGVHQESLKKKPQELDDSNIVGEYSLKNSVHKSGDPQNLDPSYTTQAQACTAGFLMINGLDLHSHMMLHANGAKADYSDNSEIDPVIEAQEEFPKRLDEFFNHLDSLIRSGKLDGQTISIDAVLAGSTERYDGEHPKIGSVVETSKDVRNTMIDLLSSRVSNIQSLGKEHGVEINFSQSNFLNQKVVVRSDICPNVGEMSATHMHYDPQTNTLSINAEYGLKANEGMSITSTDRNAVDGKTIYDHYGDMQLGKHVSPQAAQALAVKEIQGSFSSVTQTDIEVNQARYTPESLKESRFNSDSYPYSMNMAIDDSKISTGVGNGKVYFAISSPGRSFGYSLNADGKVEELKQHELPVESQRSGIPDSYFFATPLLFKGTTTPIESLESVEQELATALADDQKTVAFYTGAGFSKDSGIDDLNGFNKRIFGDSELYNLDELIKNLKDDPKSRLESIAEFFASLDTSQPTKGHKALRDLASTVNSPMPLFTENTDTLHQQTGIPTVALDRTDVEILKSSVDPEQIKNLDYLVTSGLSHDDRGFIAYLREINPELKIIANDLPGSVPDFYNPGNPNDLYLAGSAHDVFPKILEKVSTLRRI